jgi:hypothetical protein
MKKNIIIAILVIINIVVLISFSISKSRFYIDKNEMQNEIVYYNRLESYFTSKLNIEGHHIWETGVLTKTDFYKLSKEIKFPKLIFWYDSLGCSRCYTDQVRNIKNKIGVMNTLIIYNGKYTFLKLDLRNCLFVNASKGNKKFSDFLALVDTNGRIIFGDFPEYGLAKFNGMFYNLVRLYMSN